MKRIKFLTMLVLLTFVGRAFADNLKVNDITLNAGATQEIAIEMVNPDKTYTAFQFDLVLPEGITIAKNARNKLIASLNADRIDDQTLNVSEVGNNTYRFISFSMSNAEFYDAEGALVYVTLAAAEDITGGTKVATIASQVITEVSGDQYKWDDLSFNIAVPSAGIAIDATNFPDENFRNYLLSQDYGQDALLTEEEIQAVTKIDVDNKGIHTLAGIEFLTNLKWLCCADNFLTELCVSSNTALEMLYCSRNQLTSLDVSNNTALNWLQFDSNQLSSLDLTNNPALTTLYAGYNKITSLNVSNNTLLTVLDVTGNQLSSIDVSHQTLLTELDCWDNQITSLDISNNPNLEKLICGMNPLSSLNVSNNTKLTYIECRGCQIKEREMDALIAGLPIVESGTFYVLEETDDMECTPAQVTAANAKGWMLYKLVLNDTEWVWVEMSGEVAPTGIAIDATNFPDENFRAWLLSQDYGQDALLTEEEIAGITEINVSEKGIADLTGVELFTKLTHLWCDNNQLTSLDVSKNTTLQVLACSGNQLTSLDVSKNGALTQLDCCSNQIQETAMDELISSLPAGESKNMYAIGLPESGKDNKITPAQVAAANAKGWKVFQMDAEAGWVEMSGEVAPTGIAIDATNFPDENFRAWLLSQNYGQDALLTEEEIARITIINVPSKGIADLTGIELFTNLKYLSCGSNQLTSLDLSKNVALMGLFCYRNQIKDTAMDELLSSLPTVASGNLHAMYPPESGEGNVITPAQVAAANAKGWKVFQYDAETGEWVEMSGEVAPTGVAIDATNFPDENFRTWLLSQDYGQDALLTEEEIEGITVINVSERGIADLTGIELFTNLTNLRCGGNQLTSLDLSKNVELQRLYCFNNQLTSLDVSNNVKLLRLYCYNNQIKDTAMDELISSLPTVDSGNLYAMYPPESGEGNKITPAQVAAANAKGWKVFKYQYGHDWVEMSGEEPPAGIAIDATNFPDDNFRAWLLRQDYGQDGVLTEEEIQAVTEIDVHQKGISVLKGIEFFTALTSLECSSNQLTSLDVSLNTALVGLYCNDNQLTSLDVSKNTALTQLYCGHNQLTSLDVSKNTTLTHLGCHYNQLTSLDVSKNTALVILYCDNNQLTSLDVSKNVVLQDLSCGGNQLTSLDVSNNTALVLLNCDNNQLTSLDLTNNDELMTLYCDGNQLTSLDVTKNVKLEYLNCEANKLTSLDVSYNTALVRLYCGHNQLTSLDVTKNVALTLLFCYNNQLKSLDVTNNVALTRLSIICNQISGTEMDKLVSSLPSIDYGTLFAIDYTQEEGNVVTPKQVSAANARGWQVTRWDAETERYVEMSGEDPDGIQSADKGKLTVDDAVIYTLSGQRLSKPQRGVNIINGKKMVVK